MSVVYGREQEAQTNETDPQATEPAQADEFKANAEGWPQADEFGVSGYVYKNVFLIFDRRTESLWYPLDDTQWTAVSGPRKGETIPFSADPPVVPLGEWRKKHPDTVVLLGSKSAIESAGSE